jgi:AraC-like DNA-binding protein
MAISKNLLAISKIPDYLEPDGGQAPDMEDFTRDLKLKIYSARLDYLDSSWRTENFLPAYRIVPSARLYFPVEGEGVVAFDGDCHRLRPGFIFLFPPFARTQVFCPERLVKYWVHFNAFIMDSSLDLFSVYDCARSLEVTNPDIIKHLFSQIIDARWRGGKPGGDFIQKLESESALALLLAPFMRTVSGGGEKSMAAALKFSRLLEYIERNISRKISLSELAAMFGYHPIYLSNLFAKKAGMPLISYCTQRRVRHAINLMWTTDLTISEIAAGSGFTHTSNFSKMFKKLTGPPNTKKI